jgi:cell division protein FtsX
MATIVIKLDAKANQDKLVEAIEMLKGVKSVTIANSQDIEDRILIKEMTASRRSGKGNKDKVMDFLRK